MRKSGFKQGYHPVPSEIEHLKILDKKKRTYIDRRGNTYSNRAVQEARNGYVTIEEAKELREQGWGDLLNFKQRGLLPLSIPTLARSWENKLDKMHGSWKRGKQFQKHLRELIKRINAEESEDYYDNVEEYLDDYFGLAYEEIDFYG